MKALKLNLVNAFKLSVLQPDTFEVPSFEEITSLQVDDFVKVCLEEEDTNGERFWCQVKKIDPANRLIQAEVNNNLVFYDYPVGTLLEFTFDNVYSILKNGIMRKNAQRVFDLHNDLYTEIKDWFMTKPDITKIDLQNRFKVYIDEDLNYDFGPAKCTITTVTGDGYVIDEDGNSINICELKPFELAYILDELQEKKFTIVD